MQSLHIAHHVDPALLDFLYNTLYAGIGVVGLLAIVTLLTKCRLRSSTD